MLLRLGRLLAIGLLVSSASIKTPAQSAGGARQWGVDDRLILDMKCTASPAMSFEFPSLSLRADGFEITRAENNVEADGRVTNSVRLLSAGGASATGEARASSRSAHRLDSHLAFIFDRKEGVPFTDPSWKPTKIVMLRLKQDRRNPLRFTLEPAPGDTSQFRSVSLTCERASAERAPSEIRP